MIVIIVLPTFMNRYTFGWLLTLAGLALAAYHLFALWQAWDARPPNSGLWAWLQLLPPDPARPARLGDLSGFIHLLSWIAPPGLARLLLRAGWIAAGLWLARFGYRSRY